MMKTVSMVALLMAVLALPPAARAQMDMMDNIEATSAILGAGTAAAKVRHLSQVPSVGVINIEAGYFRPFGQHGSEVRTLEIYADRNATGIAHLRHALAANPITRRALADQGVDIGRVIGVAVGATGSLRLFIH